MLVASTLSARSLPMRRSGKNLNNNPQGSGVVKRKPASEVTWEQLARVPEAPLAGISLH